MSSIRSAAKRVRKEVNSDFMMTTGFRE
jgi:hypothetical protein